VLFLQKSTKHIAAKEKKRSAAGSKALHFVRLGDFGAAPSGGNPAIFLGSVGYV